MTNPTAPLLSESEVSEIEARANAATQSYVVDWSKGEHALLQASGWRPANEEQPRTIATFDKEEGYLDLLFCAEARTDIPALIRDRRALKAANEALGQVGLQNAQLIDRIRLWSKCADGYPLDEHINNIATQNAALREQLGQAVKERDALRNSSSLVAFQAHQIDGQIAESLTRHAATSMRSLCVEKVKQIRNSHRVSNNQDYEYGYEAAMDQVEANLESLTLDQVEQKQK